MAQVTKNEIPPVVQPPTTYDITGLTAAEYRTLWEALHATVYPNGTPYRAAHWAGEAGGVAKKVLNYFVAGPPVAGAQ